MTWDRGLRRISLAAWSLLAVVATIAWAFIAFSVATPNSGEIAALAGMIVGGWIIAFFAHKVTCWIIAGFFPTP